MHGRKLARRLAMQYGYMVDVRASQDVEPPAAFLAAQTDDAEARRYAAALLAAMLPAREAIDAELAGLLEHYDWPRVAAVERNILRLACAELRQGATPPRVVINEAVNLAKAFGGKDSGAFVNGVLDRLAGCGRAEDGTDGQS